MTAPTPLTESVRVTGVEPRPGNGTHVSATVTVDPDNPILAGHYPQLPIFPGVCLIECVHMTVLAVAGNATPVMEAVLTARFTDTVFPGEQVGIETTIAREEHVWTARAVLTGQRGPAARISLRYRVAGGEP